MDFKKTIYFVLIAAFYLVSSDATASRMSDYAEQCTQEIGLPVPDFNCWDGEAIQGQGAHYKKNDGPCEKPSFFNSGRDCNPGTFQVLEDDGDVFITAICRRQHIPIGEDGFNDIAVIQTSRVTGATCFYQRGIPKWQSMALSPEVISPNKADVLPHSYYETPYTAQHVCASCHDAVSIIRSPTVNAVTYDGKKYVDFDWSTQTPIMEDDPLEQSKKGQPVLPLSFSDSINASTSPYWLAGQEVEEIKNQPVSITTKDNLCTACHAVGARLFLGLARDEDGKYRRRINNPTEYKPRSGTMQYNYLSVNNLDVLQGTDDLYTALSPGVEKWWMPSGRTSWDGINHPNITPEDYIASFNALEGCKEQLIELNKLREFSDYGYVYPNGDDCKVTPRNKAYRLNNSKPHHFENFANSFFSFEESPSGTVRTNWSTAIGEGGDWTFTTEGGHGRYIVNASTGRLLCATSSSSIQTCGPWEFAFARTQWKITPFNDYETNSGMPTGRSFRLSNSQYPNRYLRFSSSYKLQLVSENEEDVFSIWKIMPSEE